MKIAYVCADNGVAAFDWKKGCSIHVQEVVRALKRLGHTVDVYATNLSGEVPADLQDVTVFGLTKPDKGSRRASREQQQLNNNQRIRAALDNGGPYDLIYERYSLWSFSAMEYAVDREIPGVLEVNSPLIEEQAQFRGLVDRDGARHVAERCFSAASTILAVSDKVRDYLCNKFGVSENVVVIPNGVDPNRFTEVFRQRRPQGARFTIGFVGSLKPWHGIHELIDAFALVREHAPRSGLLIVGDGPERESIEWQVCDMGLSDSVTLTGAVKPDDVPELLGEMDVGVAPYPQLADHYFSPMKVFEYMAAGLPVVATSAGQLTEILHDECTGLLCEPGDTNALADALLCLQRDTALRMRLGRASRCKVTVAHTWQSVVSRMLAFSDQHPPQRAGALANVAP